MPDDAKGLKCIILTLRTDNVLIPEAAVADILSVREVSEVENAPPWILGKMMWRGFNIPLVSYEAAGGVDTHSVSVNTQVAVIHAVSDSADETPYIGMVVTGVPHVSHFTRDQITANTEAQANHPMVAQKIKVNGAAVSILDINAMEEMISNAAV